MTKKEKAALEAALEAALTAAALRTTADVEPDLPLPAPWVSGRALRKGFLPIAETSDYPRVDVACSDGLYHSSHRDDKVTSQGGRALYSTRLLALRALRRLVEKYCAERLRRVDRMIEEEERR